MGMRFKWLLLSYLLACGPFAAHAVDTRQYYYMAPEADFKIVELEKAGDSGYLDPEFSGKTQGLRCNPFHPDKHCNSGLDCLEEKLEIKWADFKQECRFHWACDPSKKSPQQLCNEACNGVETECAKCLTKSTKCAYRGPCLRSYFIPRPHDNVQVDACERHTDCTSGYCSEMRDLPAQASSLVPPGQTLKVCLPYSKCTRPCKGYGETMNSGDYCCKGLDKVHDSAAGKDICYVGELPTLPDNISYKVPESCAPKLYEETDGVINTDYNLVAKKYWSFERFIWGLEWLWGQADSDGTGDYFGMHAKAKTLAQNLTKEREKADNFYVKELVRLAEIKEQLLTGSGRKGGESVSGEDTLKTVNSSSGVEYLRLMAEEHEAQARISERKVTLYTSLLGVDYVDLQMKVKNPELLPSKKYKYDDYGTHGSIVYCEAWFPHCWFSKNICGTYFQQNKVCVKEGWEVEGVAMGGKKKLLDPLYPKAMWNNSTFFRGPDTYEFFRMVNRAMWEKIEKYAPLAVAGDSADDNWAEAGGVALAVACPAVAVAVAVFEIFTSLNYQIPVKHNEFNNNRALLVSKLKPSFKAYADKILTGDNGGNLSYNTQNNVRNIQAYIEKDELKMAFQLANPDLGELQLIEGYKIIEASFKRDDLRAMAIDRITEVSVEILNRYSGADGWEYKTDASGYLETDVSNMIQYMSKYHSAAQGMHREVAACLRQRAAKFDQNLASGTVIRPGSVPVGNSVAIGLETTPPVSVTPCQGPSCQNNGPGSGATFSNANFGIDSLNTGAFGSNSGGNNNNINGGNVTGGVVTLGNGSDTLATMSKKQLDARNRHLRMFGKKGFHKETGSDRALNKLNSINGAHALVAMMKKYGANSGASALSGISAPVDPNAHGKNGSGKNGEDGAGAGKTAGKAPVEGGSEGGDSGNIWGSNSRHDSAYGRGDGSTAGGLTSYERDALLRDSGRNTKGENIDPDSDTLFKQISRAYLRYGVPRLLKKKE